MRKGMTLLIFLFSFLLFSQHALAIGIGPSRTIMDFEPDYSGTVDYIVVNGEDRTLNVDLYVSGDLSEYISLSETKLVLAPGETKALVARLSLPAEISPGTHDIRIGALESAPEGGMLAARAGVEAQLWIRAPYPDKYLQLRVSAADAEEGGQASITATAENLGKENVTASVLIEVYDSKGLKMASLPAGSSRIDVGESKEFNATWQGGAKGSYKAKAAASYDGKSGTAEAAFNVGNILVWIARIHAGDIEQGSKAEVRIEIESSWPETISGVYAELIAGGWATKTGSIDLGAFSRANLTAEWDTRILAVGSYPATARLYYAGKRAESSTVLNVIERSSLLPEMGTETIIMLAALIIVLALLAIFSMRLIRGRK